MLRDFDARFRRPGQCIAVVLTIAIAAISTLSACGVKGPLKPPTPAAAKPAAGGPDAAAGSEQVSPPAPAQPSRAEPEPQPPATRP